MTTSLHATWLPQIVDEVTALAVRVHLESVVKEVGPLPSAGVVSSPPEGRWPASQLRLKNLRKRIQS